MSLYPLIDNTTESQYELHIGNYIAKIEYEKPGNGTIILPHTEVPSELEGQGIGSQLVKAVLNDISQKELLVVPICPFVSGYIKKHPEWEYLVFRPSS